MSLKIQKLKETPVSIEYFAHYDVDLLPGVTNKINQTVLALCSAGFKSQGTIVSAQGFRGLLELLKRVWSSSSDILIVRNSLFFPMPLLMPFLMWKRVMGKKIIIDVPTPITIVLRELKVMYKVNAVGTITRIAILLFCFPWALYPANKVLQYAKESAFFSLGIRRKTQLIANGISVENRPIQNNTLPWPTHKFVMIAVASLAPWHGFDRLIRGIAEYYKLSNNPTTKFQLIIVGDGEVRQEWEQLVVQLDLIDSVVFTGCQTGLVLDDLFNQAHIAIASLGLYRKGLDMASDLKSREYTARGIPFITSGEDIDFIPPPEFMFKAANSAEPINLQAVLKWYSILREKNIKNTVIRQYAVNRLDYHNKIFDIIQL